MGGFSYTVINGKAVKFGDLCEVEIYSGREMRKLLCTFLERSDDGDNWFCCVREEDCVRGDSNFSDYYVEVGQVRVIGKETVEMFSSEGI